MCRDQNCRRRYKPFPTVEVKDAVIKSDAVAIEIGLDKKLIEGTLRFSFCENTTKEELDQALKALKELLPMLRRYTRR